MPPQGISPRLRPTLAVDPLANELDAPAPVTCRAQPAPLPGQAGQRCPTSHTFVRQLLLHSKLRGGPQARASPPVRAGLPCAVSYAAAARPPRCLPFPASASAGSQRVLRAVIASSTPTMIM